MDKLVRICESKWFWFPIWKSLYDEKTKRINLRKAAYGTIAFSFLSLALIIIILFLVLPYFTSLEENYSWLITLILTTSIIGFLVTFMIYAGAILILRNYYLK